MTMQAFEKLVDAAGSPPDPVADPPPQLPPIDPGKTGTSSTAWDSLCSLAGPGLVVSLLGKVPVGKGANCRHLQLGPGRTVGQFPAWPGYGWRRSRLFAGRRFTSAQETRLPSLSEHGYTEVPTSPFPGGETAALARMSDHLRDRDWVAKFAKPETDPSAFVRRVWAAARRPSTARCRLPPFHCLPLGHLDGEMRYRPLCTWAGVGCVGTVRCSRVCSSPPHHEKPDLREQQQQEQTGMRNRRRLLVPMCPLSGPRRRFCPPTSSLGASPLGCFTSSSSRSIRRRRGLIRSRPCP